MDCRSSDGLIHAAVLEWIDDGVEIEYQGCSVLPGGSYPLDVELVDGKTPTDFVPSDQGLRIYYADRITDDGVRRDGAFTLVDLDDGCESVVFLRAMWIDLVKHEIGHFLDLEHVDDTDNLMHPDLGETLTDDQIDHAVNRARDWLEFCG